MTMSQFCFDMTYMWFKNAPGSTWELQAGRQRLAIWQMQDDDTKDWEAVIKCVRPVEMIYTLEPLDRALQELEGGVRQYHEAVAPTRYYCKSNRRGVSDNTLPLPRL